MLLINRLKRMVNEEAGDPITLRPFTREYWNSLPADRSRLELSLTDTGHIRNCPTENNFYVIYEGEEAAGIIGYYKFPGLDDTAITLMVLNEGYRGGRVSGEAMHKMYQEVGLPKFISFVRNDNVRCMRAHERSPHAEEITGDLARRLDRMGIIPPNSKRFLYVP